MVRHKSPSPSAGGPWHFCCCSCAPPQPHDDHLTVVGSWFGPHCSRVRRKGADASKVDRLDDRPGGSLWGQRGLDQVRTEKTPSHDGETLALIPLSFLVVLPSKTANFSPCRFSNNAKDNGSIEADCKTIHWHSGGAWIRTGPAPPPGPVRHCLCLVYPPPSWLKQRLCPAVHQPGPTPPPPPGPAPSPGPGPADGKRTLVISFHRHSLCVLAAFQCPFLTDGGLCFNSRPGPCLRPAAD